MLTDRSSYTLHANPCLDGVIFLDEGVAVFHSMRDRRHRKFEELLANTGAVHGFYGGGKASRDLSFNFEFYEKKHGMLYVPPAIEKSSFSVFVDPIYRFAA